MYFFIMLLLISYSAQERCPMLEEGQPLQLTYDDRFPQKSLAWQKDDNVISHCENSTCHTTMPGVEVTRASGKITLTVLKIKRNNPTDEAEWRCGYDDENLTIIVGSCILHIYVKPDTPTCIDTVDMDYLGAGTVKLVCFAKTVYPMGSCNLFLKRPDESTFTYIEYAIMSNRIASQNPLLYTFNCSLTLNITAFGDYSVYAEMFAGLLSGEPSNPTKQTTPIKEFKIEKPPTAYLADVPEEFRWWIIYVVVSVLVSLLATVLTWLKCVGII
ncbi:uncharacterized protein LOC131947941 [Physella acuta]|uniref:uncharacterized protein LOC131947941 n=1 Tax=Physella acuta TaxID=109671 RepID=UPI0027DBC6BF|nr:uncharacterized protein LOC131947941 [Physella acuta]